jgi:hypothetical protein
MSKPTLRHFASIWTLMDYPHGSASDEWTMEQKVAAIKEAGFDGFQWAALPELKDLAEKYDLAFLGGCQANAGNYSQTLQDFAPFNPLRINVQLGNHAMQPEEAVDLWIAMNKEAADLGLTLDLETHRDTCTETPEKTWRIAELYSQKTGELILLNFDFSHFAVVKHLYPPYADRLLDRPDLLRVTSQIHLRPFNGHHCEIPVTDSNGKISGWAASWFEFVKDALTCWCEGKSSSDTLWECPELGSMTSGYWIPSFPDPWKDTIAAKQAISQIWEKIEK